MKQKDDQGSRKIVAFNWKIAYHLCVCLKKKKERTKRVTRSSAVGAADAANASLPLKGTKTTKQGGRNGATQPLRDIREQDEAGLPAVRLHTSRTSSAMTNTSQSIRRRV